MKYKKPIATIEQKVIFMAVIAKAKVHIGKIRYIVLEELSDTYDDMAWFVQAIQENGIIIDGEAPDRVKKALLEYGIKI
jgi:hypothetical protein